MDAGDLIHAQFSALALKHPEALAVASVDGPITYGRLDALSRQLAARIVSSDRRGGPVVGILAERGASTVVAALACARAGRPFVILDLSYPQARLEALVEVCGPGLLLAAGAQAPKGALAFDLPMLGVVLDPSPHDAPAAAHPGGEASPDGPAYLLFTSGSTGSPKCVACSHRPLVNFIDWQVRTFGLTADDRFTMLSGLSHDPILRDIFTPLSIGASIHIPPQDVLTAPGGLYDWFVAARPTVAHMTPPLGHLLTSVRRGTGRLDDLRHVFWGGDVLRYALVDALTDLAPRCESVNFYGATETPQAASFFRASAETGGDRAPIGVGIDGFRLEIRDEDGATIADGRPGEIVVRSRFLTMGYVTGGRLPPARPCDEEQTYATGDMGHRRADGQIVIQGRRDDQVKIRGYRVELGEITACALKAADVGQAITLDIGAPDQVRLCCFVQPANDGELDPPAVREHIAANLPAYMVPDSVVAVGAFPLLPNGKIDRQALIRSETERANAADRPTGSLTPTQAALVDQWRKFLRRDRIDVEESFASLGGDSLSYVNAYLSLEEVLGRVPDRWTTMSIAELAATKSARAGRGLFVGVESAMLMRAVAIAAVVGSHFQLFVTGGAATSALLWVSGYLFGGLQLHEADHQSSAKPVGRLLRSVLIPVLAIELPQAAVKFAMHYHAKWSSVFLYVDLLDFTGMDTDGPNAYGGAEYLMWYIDCVFHIMLLYAALILVFTHVVKLRRPAVAAACAAVALGLFGRFVAPVLFLPDFWKAQVDPMSYFNHAPTTHLATFALAALAGFLKGRWRIATMAAVLAYAMLSAPSYGAGDAIAIALVAAFLIFVPKLGVPRVLSTPIYLVAGASLFIYLLHFKFLVVFNHLHLPAIAAWPGALVGGVVVWSLWNWGAQRAAAIWTARPRHRLDLWRDGTTRRSSLAALLRG